MRAETRRRSIASSDSSVLRIYTSANEHESGPSANVEARNESQQGEFKNTEFLNNEDPLISQLENFPRLNLRVINTKSIQPISGGPFKNHLKIQVFGAAYTAHK